MINNIVEYEKEMGEKINKGIDICRKLTGMTMEEFADKINVSSARLKTAYVNRSYSVGMLSNIFEVLEKTKVMRATRVTKDVAEEIREYGNFIDEINEGKCDEFGELDFKYYEIGELELNLFAQEYTRKENEELKEKVKELDNSLTKTILFYQKEREEYEKYKEWWLDDKKFEMSIKAEKVRLLLTNIALEEESAKRIRMTVGISTEKLLDIAELFYGEIKKQYGQEIEV